MNIKFCLLPQQWRHPVKEFVPTGQTVNAAFYEDILKLLLRRIRRVRPELRRTGQWMSLHDNALAESICANSWVSAAYLFSIIHRTSLIWRLRTSLCFPA